MLRYFLILLSLLALNPLFAQRESGRNSGSSTRSAPTQSARTERGSNQTRSSLTPQSARSQRNNPQADDRSRTQGASTTTSRSERNIPYAPSSGDRSNGSYDSRTENTRPSSQRPSLWTYDQSTLLNQNASPRTQSSKSTPANTLQAKGLKEVGRVNWMTLEQAIERSKTEKRKIYIDVYTDWCGWCKQMDSTTFTNPAVAKYLNDNFYAVKFNAEQQQDVSLNGKTYKFVPNGSRGHHELAAFWLNNRLSFPTSVFLDENLNTIQPLPGYLDALKLEAIINYFGTNSHRTTPWETYEKKFSSQR